MDGNRKDVIVSATKGDYDSMNENEFFEKYQDIENIVDKGYLYKFSFNKIDNKYYFNSMEKVK